MTAEPSTPASPHAADTPGMGRTPEGAASIPAPSIPALLQSAVEEASRLLEADGAMLYLLDEATGELRFSYDAGVSDLGSRQWVRQLTLRPGEGLFGRAVAEGRVHRTDDYPADRSFVHASGPDRIVREAEMRSLVAAPLVAAGRTFGALGAFSHRVAAFGERDVALVRSLADHAAAAMANARLIEEIETREAELERRADAERTLREFAARIITVRDPDALLQDVVEEAVRLVRGDGAILAQFDPEAGLLRWGYDDGLRDRFDADYVENLTLEVGVGVTGLALAERRPIVCNEDLVDAFPRTAESDHFFEVSGFRAMIAAPIIGESGPLGALEVYARQEGAFTDADASLVAALADEAAIAITNARLIRELRQSREELARSAEVERALREIGSRITALQEQADVLQQTVDEAARLLGADGARIDLVDPASGGLHWAFDAATGRRGGLGPIHGGGPARPGEGISGRAVDEGRAIYTGDYLTDDRFEHSTAPDDHVRRHGIRSAVAAPIVGEHGALGTVTVYTSEPGAYGPEHARIVEALASQAAVAMTNATLIDELRRSRERLARKIETERALREIASRIAAIRDVRDVLQYAADEAVRLLEADGAGIETSLADGGAGPLPYEQVFSGPAEPPVFDPGETAPDDGIGGQAVARNRTLWTGDYLADTSFRHTPAQDRYVVETGIRSVIVAPLPGEAGPLGMLSVLSRRADAFDAADAEVLAAIANHASIAITNARLISELATSREAARRRAEAEQSLRELAAKITAMRDPGEILSWIVGDAARLLGAERSQIDLVGDAGGHRQFSYPERLSPPMEQLRTASSAVEHPEAGMAAYAIATRGAVITDDYLVDDAFDHFPDADEYVRQVGLRSVVAAPLFGEAGLLGVLQVGTSRPAAYGPADASIIEALANQAAIALTNARLIEELARSREEVARRAEAERSLREIAARITAIRDPGIVLRRIADDAARLVGAERAQIDLVEPAGGSIQWTYPAGEPVLGNGDDGARAGIEPPEAGIAGRAIRERRPVVTGDYLADPSFKHVPDADEAIASLGLRSIVAAPLFSDDALLGVLQVATGRGDAFTDADAETIEALANQAAIALTNARLIEELGRSEAELAARVETERSLREISGRITVLRDRGELLERIVEEARRLLGSDGAHITLLSEDGTYLVPEVVAGVDEEMGDWLRTRRFPLGASMNGLAASQGEAVWTFDYRLDPRIPRGPEDLELASRMGLRGMAAAPLRGARDDVIGTLAVSYAVPREITADELALLQALADQAAIAVTNGRLYDLLRTSEERYRHLVQNSPDLVWSIDADARLTFVSDTCVALTGWFPEDLLGRHFGVLVHPDSGDVATIDWTAGLSPESRQLRGRLSILHRDGHAIPAEFSAMSFLDDDGRFAGATGSVRDMSERDRLERELRDSEERYRFLVENSPDIIFSTDAQGRYTYYSETVEQLTGWKPEDLLGQHFSKIIDLATFPAAEVAWQAFVEHPDQMQVHRFSLHHRDGQRLPVEVSAVGITDADGRFGGIHGAARDISERERLERELRRQAGELAANEERSHLARELHDSVTQALFSMTLLTRSIELLLQRDPSAVPDKLVALRELQRDALAEMRSLIFELRPGSLEQDGLVHALKTHAAAVQGRIGLPVVLEADLPGRLPIEIEDALFRIAQEALHNVVKHAAARQVRLSLTRRDGEVRLVVADDGKGFDMDTVPSGHLGLAGMRARAEKVGGSLAVESKPGTGTSIRITVPVATHSAEGSDEP